MNVLLVGAGQMGSGIALVAAMHHNSVLKQYVAAGWYGKKSGRGFYSYAKMAVART